MYDLTRAATKKQYYSHLTIKHVIAIIIPKCCFKIPKINLVLQK